MNPKTISVIIAGIFIIAGFAAGYLPPTYIANPETGECKYYFAGDARHHNPLPNGSWYMVGLAEENRSICQWACLRLNKNPEISFHLHLAHIFVKTAGSETYLCREFV